MATFVIVGAGLAGAKAAETLRTEGFDGTVILLGAEPERPYERPPLSKGYLLGKETRDSAFVHPADWYAEHDVDLRTGVTVTSIDRAARTLAISSSSSLTPSAPSAPSVPSAPPGESDTLAYDKLLLTPGAAARQLDVPGSALDGIYYLRTMGESERLRAAFAAGSRVVIVGSGWIGLETAAAARLAGCPVTIIERDPSPLWATIGPELGEMFGGLHREHGVEFRFGETVTQLVAAPAGEAPPDSAPESPNTPARQVGAVVTSGGASIPADVVVVGIGAIPNDRLPAAAGLEVEAPGGVVTDASLRTSDPDIYAAGDVARSFNPVLGRHIRVDHWSNALNGGPAAAKAMLGQDVSYDRVPYFFSDQYDLGMECSGLPSAGSYDQVVYRGDVGGREFIAFWLSRGRLVAGMNVNVWDVTDDVQSLIRSGRVLDATRLSDPSIPLSDI